MQTLSLCRWGPHSELPAHWLLAVDPRFGAISPRSDLMVVARVEDIGDEQNGVGVSCGVGGVGKVFWKAGRLVCCVLQHGVKASADTWY